MIQNKIRRKVILLTTLSDIAAILVSFVAAYGIRFTFGIIPTRGAHPDFIRYYHAAFIVLPVYLILFRSYGLYQMHRHIRRVEEIFLVIRAVTFATVFLMALTFFYRGFSYSRAYLFILWIVSILVVSVTRYLMIQWQYRSRIQQKDVIRTLVIGGNRNARQIIQWAKNNPHFGYEIIGVLANAPADVGKHLEGISILGVADQCESFISHLKPNAVILVDHDFSRSRIADLVALCEDQWIEFKIAADFYGIMSRSVNVEYLSSIPLLGFKPLPLDDFWNRVLKRMLDVVFSLLLLILTLPLFLAVALVIKLTDRGPVFYAQERMGRDQKVFKVLKFRTMKVNAEAKTGPVWAKANDDRRTAIGNFLRKTNIDELPQFLNVLKGEMSVVGPRPERPHFIEQFRSEIPRYMTRHKIKSGITGWAQVNGYRGNTSLQERIKYDLYYMENWSLLFDLEIIFMTIFAFKNAY